MQQHQSSRPLSHSVHGWLKPGRQYGFVLLLFFLVTIVGVSIYFLYHLDSSSSSRLHSAGLRLGNQKTMQRAKEALIAYAITFPERTDVPPDSGPGFLPCPDNANDGVEDASCTTSTDSTLGRLPWKTLGIEELRDSSGTRLWYVVSERYRNNPATHPLNSATAGDLRIGTIIETMSEPAIKIITDDVVALIIAPGRPIGSQAAGRPSNNRNDYLEAPNNSVPTVVRLIDFPGGSRRGNDQILPITRSDLMRAVERRVLHEVQQAFADYHTRYGSYPLLVPLHDPRIPLVENARRGEPPNYRIGEAATESSGNTLFMDGNFANRTSDVPWLVANLTDAVLGVSSEASNRDDIAVLPLAPERSMEFSPGDDVVLIYRPSSYLGFGAESSAGNQAVLGDEDEPVLSLLHENDVVANLSSSQVGKITNIDAGTRTITVDENLLFTPNTRIAIARHSAPEIAWQANAISEGLLPLHAPGAPFATPMTVQWNSHAASDLQLITPTSSANENTWALGETYLVTLSSQPGHLPPTASSVLHSTGSTSTDSTNASNNITGDGFCIWWTPTRMHCQVSDDKPLRGTITAHGPSAFAKEIVLTDSNKNFLAAGVRPGDAISVNKASGETIDAIITARTKTALNTTLKRADNGLFAGANYHIQMHTAENQYTAPVNTNGTTVFVAALDPRIKENDILQAHNNSDSATSTFFARITAVDGATGKIDYEVFSIATPSAAIRDEQEFTIYHSAVTQRQYRFRLSFAGATRTEDKKTARAAICLGRLCPGSTADGILPANIRSPLLIIDDLVEDNIVGSARLIPESDNANFSYAISGLRLGLEPNLPGDGDNALGRLPAWLVREHWQELLYAAYNSDLLEFSVARAGRDFIAIAGMARAGQDRHRRNAGRTAVTLADYFERTPDDRWQKTLPGDPGTNDQIEILLLPLPP